MTDTATITRLLNRWQGGDEAVMNELMPLIYDQLHQLAWRTRGAKGCDVTMRPTAIVNEAFLKLKSSHKHTINRQHFFAAAAITMRHIMVDFARHKNREKRGGCNTHFEFDDNKLVDSDQKNVSTDIINLNEALEILESKDPRKTRIIELHYFTGLNYEEIAEILDISPATVGRELKFTKAWLAQEMDE